MYQAGTLSGNPLAMVAGIKTLEILDRPGAYEHLDAVTGKLIQGLLQAGRDAGHDICGGHITGEFQLSRCNAVLFRQIFIFLTCRLTSGYHCGCGGMFGFFFTKGPVTCFEEAKEADTAKFGRFHRGMLERGVYLAPSAYEVHLPVPSPLFSYLLDSRSLASHSWFCMFCSVHVGPYLRSP